MKLHKEFDVNPSPCICPCCGKVLGYYIYGDAADESLINKFHIADFVCDECTEKLKESTVFLSADIDEETDKIKIVYDIIWIKNIGLKEYFKDLSQVNIINIIPKEHFYQIFGNVITDLEKDKK